MTELTATAMLRADRTPSVLVVDDETEQLQRLVQALQARGYDCEGAGSADEAIQCLETSSYSLVLLDPCIPQSAGSPDLPAQDFGLRVYDKVIELNGTRNRSTRVAIVTATVLPEVEEVWKRLPGVWSFFRKWEHVWAVPDFQVRPAFLRRVGRLLEELRSRDHPASSDH